MAYDPRFLRIQHYLKPEVRHFYSLEAHQRRSDQRRAAMETAKALRQTQHQEEATAEVLRLQEQHHEEAARHPLMIADLNRLERAWKLV
jgi:hypothetical protein